MTVPTAYEVVADDLRRCVREGQRVPGDRTELLFTARLERW
ncbi:hypothetical protein [Streptomyces mutabilis]|nr:hypothetical protein [Streptomyces mutabilis]